MTEAGKGAQGHPNDVDNAGVLSPYGTMGQGGNVLEWIETEMGPSRRGLRGGPWYSHPDFMKASYRDSSPSTNEMIDSFGFRVASVSAIPEPGSVAMLAGLAVTGLVYWRRRKA